MKTERRARRNFDEDFKLTVVKLIHNGAKRKDVIEKYGLTPSAVDKWLRQYSNSGTFSSNDSLTDQEKELIQMKKENQQLKMENDILKQAALLFARK